MVEKLPRGVQRNGSKYRARIKDRSGKRRSLGSFDTLAEAVAAYDAAYSEARLLLPSVNRPKLTQERLKSMFGYDPLTGLFTRLTTNIGLRGRHGVGSVAGCVNKVSGYIDIKVDGKKYPAHRLVWLYMTGSFPENQIDHIDGDKANNRLKNLRPATYADNAQNRPAVAKNTSGLLGVSWHSPSSKFMARITVNHKTRTLGYFRSPIDAHDAYLAAKARLHEFQPVPR